MDQRMGAGNDFSAQSAQSARQSQADLQARVRLLDRRVEYLSVVVESIWELLAERGGISEEILAQKVIEVDARDGQLDGRRKLPMSDCPCGAKIGSHASSCAFCGQVREVANLFDRR